MTQRDTRNSDEAEARHGGPPVVSCRNVSFSYPGAEERALFDVSFEARAGEYIGIVGPNGGGKSTLVRILNGLLKPEAGDVRVFDLDPSIEPFEVRKHVGMLFQNPDNGLVSPFVEDDVAFGLENLGVGRKEMLGRVHEAMLAVGLEGYERRETHTLSGGEKQRVALAGLLAVEPDILALDEPTSMLDASGRREVLERLDKLRGKKTILHATHHLEELFDADRILVLKDGELAADIPPERLFSDGDLMRRNRLAPPTVIRLAESLGVPPRRSAEAFAAEILKRVRTRTSG